MPTAAAQAMLPLLVLLFLITGTINTLSTKFADMQCV